MLFGKNISDICEPTFSANIETYNKGYQAPGSVTTNMITFANDDVVEKSNFRSIELQQILENFAFLLQFLVLYAIWMMRFCLLQLLHNESDQLNYYSLQLVN